MNFDDFDNQLDFTAENWDKKIFFFCLITKSF